MFPRTQKDVSTRAKKSLLAGKKIFPHTQKDHPPRANGNFTVHYRMNSPFPDFTPL